MIGTFVIKELKTSFWQINQLFDYRIGRYTRMGQSNGKTMLFAEDLQ